MKETTKYEALVSIFAILMIGFCAWLLWDYGCKRLEVIERQIEVEGEVEGEGEVEFKVEVEDEVQN